MQEYRGDLGIALTDVVGMDAFLADFDLYFAKCGRLVTTAFHFELDTTHLPQVRGQDDAKEAKWVPLAELSALEDQLFEDHASILDHFCGLFSSDATPVV